MTSEQEHEPRAEQLQSAVRELSAVIRARYPATTITVRPGVDDPEETWITATVDIADPDEVIDLVIDRLLELQVDEGIPIHVLPVHNAARVTETLQRQHRRTPGGLPSLPHS